MKDKIYYFQEKSNDILDLQDELTIEEIGMYFILKAAYFKNFGDLTESNMVQRCRFFGDKEKLAQLAKKLFEFKEGVLVNNSWLSQINEIKQKSKKRKEAANARWQKKEEKENKPTDLKQAKKEIKLIKEEYNILAKGLIFVLEEKMNKKLRANSLKNYVEEIRKLIEIDLKVRAEPEEDVKRAIQAIADNWEKEYFPVVESASSLREKFGKIENYLKRQGNNEGKNNIFNHNLVERINQMIGNDWIIKIEAIDEKAVLSITQNNWQKMKGLSDEIKKKIKEKLNQELKTTKIKQKYID